MRRILVFDSGLGGLTVARALRAAGQGRVAIDYAADVAGFPYGDWEEEALRAHIVSLMGRLIDAARPDVVVVACNTASVISLAALRAAHDVPFVGTVPAIKPAASRTRTGVIGVLATPGTVKREYTTALIHTFAFHCEVVLHGAPGLARMAEEKLAGHPVDPEALRREITPVFAKREGRATDVVVLGCTHYPLLREEMERVAPWPVSFIDPSPAIARRALEVAESCDDHGGIRGGRVFVTASEERLCEVLKREGFGVMVVLQGPERG